MLHQFEGRFLAEPSSELVHEFVHALGDGGVHLLVECHDKCINCGVAKLGWTGAWSQGIVEICCKTGPFVALGGEVGCVS